MKTIQKMASGHTYLTLVENINLDDFPALAEKWSIKLGAKVSSRVFNFDAHVWSVELSGESFYLAGDIWVNTLTLESTSEVGDKIIKDLKI
jgi:hypothetical protein